MLWLILSWPAIILLGYFVRRIKFTPRKPQPQKQIEAVDAEFEVVEEQIEHIDIRV